MVQKVFAVVIWYQPSDKEVAAIRLYEQDVQHTIIVDNSDTDNRALTSSLTHATYLPLMQNKGIATALNIGCRQAMIMGAEWILTMDQDSQWNQFTVRQYIDEANQYPHIDKVGLFSPVHDCDGAPNRHRHHGRFKRKSIFMCSGNLLRVTAFEQTGGFRDDFFIDIVDHEMCYHLRHLGWQLVRTNHISLTHSLGQGIVKVGPHRKNYSPHPAWRYYFIGRNFHRLLRLYSSEFLRTLRLIRRDYAIVAHYDTAPDKAEKLANYRQGWRDGAVTTVLNPAYSHLSSWISSLPHDFFSSGEVIYDARNQIRVINGPDGRLYNVKRYCCPHWFNRLIYTIFRAPKAKRAYEYAVRLTSMGISTPAPVAYILCGKGLLAESYLITEQSPLPHRMYEMGEGGVPNEVLAAFARFTADMHNKGVLHLDYSPGNILWDYPVAPLDAPSFAVVDINRMRFASVSAREGCRNFARLWGTTSMFEIMARAYAEARHLDPIETTRCILSARRHFWVHRPHQPSQYTE